MNYVKDQLIKYGETTSIRGVSRIFKHRDPFLKVMWLLSVLASTTVLAALLITIFRKFYQWPTTTTFGEMLDGENIFPDVSVCNLNPFANGYPEQLTFDDFFHCINYIEDIANSENVSDSLKQKFLDLFEKVNTVPGFIINLAKDFSAPADCPMFIAECLLYSSNWLLANNCTNSFIERWSSEYYICSTIRTSELDEEKAKNIRGMTLVLNIGPQTLGHVPFKPTLTSTETTGVRLSVHPSGGSPDFKLGLTLAPGTENVIKIYQTNIERLDSPYTSYGCTEQKQMDSDESEAYSQDVCVEFCQQFAIYKACSCVVYWYAIPTNLSDAQICGNLTDYFFESNFKKFFENSICVYYESVKDHGCEAQCYLPCKEIFYSFNLVSAPWPPISTQLGVFEDYFEGCIDKFPKVQKRYIAYDTLSKYYEGMITDHRNFTMSNLTQLRESLLMVKLVMENEFPYKTIDKPLYSWDVMVSLVGGILSLWLGITVMTVVEMMELFYFLIKGFSKNARSV